MGCLRVGAVGVDFVVRAGILLAGAVVVATYNVENYGPVDRRIDSEFRPVYPKPEAEKRALRVAIEAVRADVLALQEMGGPSYLEELRRDLKSEGLDYPFSACVEAQDVHRHVAILSRLPLKSVQPHSSLEFAYRGGRERVKRGLLEAVVMDRDGEFTVFALHLKSRLTERPDDPQAQARRLAEALAVREFIRARFPDPARARYAILGDFNDGKSSPALRRLTRVGETVLCVCLTATDSRGETWTEVYRKEGIYTDLDHILMSPALLPAVSNGSARIYDGAETAEASDHRPVWATLLISPKR
jgi:endonuclease/exonuclease/phosphatase family metal-dependent hydrolase